MKKIAAIQVLASVFLFFATAATAVSLQEEKWDRLFSPAALMTALSNDPLVQVIDIRSQKYVKKGTIPGAVAINYKAMRGPKNRPGMPPNEASLAEIIGAAGLNLDHPIIIFNHSGKTVQTGQAAYVYWLLKTAGAEEVAILSGGFKGWKSAEMPIANEPITRAPTNPQITYRLDWWADPMSIFAVATEQMDGAILDARLDAQVKKAAKTGKTLKSLPLARYMPASLLAPSLSVDRSYEENMSFRADLEERGINLNGDVLISICQNGELSALSWFYASEIVGIENVQYYPDAIQGWAADGGILFGLYIDQ